jgi:DNA polymerase-1
MILDADLSQIEWRSAAFLSQDPVMIDEISSGVDQHASACTDLMELPLNPANRNGAKGFNFRMIYADENVAPYAFYKDPSMPRFSKKKWVKIVDDFYEKYSGLEAWHRQIVQEVYKSGGYLKGPTGVTWEFFKQTKRNGSVDYNKAQIYNYPVQGISAQIIKLASIYILRRVRNDNLDAKLIMQVHDSLIWDCVKKDLDKLANHCYIIFKGLPTLLSKFFEIEWNVPLTGEIKVGPTWGETNDYAII